MGFGVGVDGGDGCVDFVLLVMVPLGCTHVLGHKLLGICMGWCFQK